MSTPEPTATAATAATAVEARTDLRTRLETAMPLAVRVLATGWGLAAVLGAGLASPEQERWWAWGLGLVLFVPPAFRRRLAVLETAGLVVVVLAVTVDALAERLSVVGAGLLGLLLVGFVLLSDLADALLGTEAVQGGIRGWLLTVGPLIGAALAAALVLGAVASLPVVPLAALVVAAPALVLLAVVLAISKRFLR